MIISDIARFSKWSNIELINKGWSNDIKYSVWEGNNRFLLRLTDIKYKYRKNQEFNDLQRISNLHIKMTDPIEFGVCNNGQHVYTLLNWVKGSDADQILPTLSEDLQYQLGISAGKMLAKIHSLKPLTVKTTWEERFNKKIDAKISSYKACGYKMPHEQDFLDYLSQHRHLLKNRPQIVQHGDFHVGNMVITPEQEIALIDFNRMDYGDPWEEFNRMPFSVITSRPFSVGLFDGYFNYDIPENFFALFALYLITNAVSSIPWSINYGESELNVAIKNIEEIFSYFKGFSTYVPQWYSDYKQLRRWNKK